MLTGGLNGLRVETEAFSPGMIVASGVRGGPQSCVVPVRAVAVPRVLACVDLDECHRCARCPASGWAARVAARDARLAEERRWRKECGFLPATEEGQALRFISGSTHGSRQSQSPRVNKPELVSFTNKPELD